MGKKQDALTKTIADKDKAIKKQEEELAKYKEITEREAKYSAEWEMK